MTLRDFPIPRLPCVLFLVMAGCQPAPKCPPADGEPPASVAATRSGYEFEATLRGQAYAADGSTQPLELRLDWAPDTLFGTWSLGGLPKQALRSLSRQPLESNAVSDAVPHRREVYRVTYYLDACQGPAPKPEACRPTAGCGPNVVWQLGEMVMQVEPVSYLTAVRARGSVQRDNPRLGFYLAGSADH